MSKTDDSILVTHICEVCHHYSYEWLELAIPSPSRIRLPRDADKFALEVEVEGHRMYLSLFTLLFIFGITGPDGWKSIYCEECGAGLPLFASYGRALHRLGILVARCTKCRTFYPYDTSHFHVYKKRMTRRCRHCYEHLAVAPRGWRSFPKHSEVGKQICLIYENQRGLCWWCGRPVGDNYHLDHRVPLARGGRDILANLVVSCPECNLKKNDRMPWEFAGRLL